MLKEFLRVSVLKVTFLKVSFMSKLYLKILSDIYGLIGAVMLKEH